MSSPAPLFCLLPLSSLLHPTQSPTLGMGAGGHQPSSLLPLAAPRHPTLQSEAFWLAATLSMPHLVTLLTPSACFWVALPTPNHGPHWDQIRLCKHLIPFSIHSSEHHDLLVIKNIDIHQAPTSTFIFHSFTAQLPGEEWPPCTNSHPCDIVHAMWVSHCSRGVCVFKRSCLLTLPKWVTWDFPVKMFRSPASMGTALHGRYFP